MGEYARGFVSPPYPTTEGRPIEQHSPVEVAGVHVTVGDASSFREFVTEMQATSEEARFGASMAWEIADRIDRALKRLGAPPGHKS